MNESFNKFFRNPEDDIKIRNQANFNDEELEEIRSDFANEIISRYNQQEELALSLEEELGEDVKERIVFVLESATDYFTSLGFPEVKFNPFLLTSGDLSSFSGIASRLGGVNAVNTNIDDMEIKQMTFLKLLSHELYHSTAAASLTVTDTFPNPDHRNRHVEMEEGASYRQGDADKTLALEEGLASRFEEMMLEKIKKQYPEVSVQYYEDIISAISEHSSKDKNDAVDIAIHSLNDGQVTFGTSEYTAPRKLVHFLASRINNFDVLVEEARLKRHTLALARAIEAEFGEGAYRRITTAKDEESYALITELSSK